MDEVVGFLAEQIAKRVRAAQQSAALAAAKTGQPATPPPERGLRRAAPAQAAPVIAADPLQSRRLRRDMPPETLAALPTLDAAVASPGPASSGAGSALLAAFRGGPPLLAALVLGEALGPPLSLQPFDARLR